MRNPNSGLSKHSNKRPSPPPRPRSNARQNDELAKGLDISSFWLKKQYPPQWLVHSTIDLHIVEYLLRIFILHDSLISITTQTETTRPSSTLTHVDDTPFSWVPPDLSEGSPWHQARLAYLCAKSDTLPDPEKVITEGKKV
jgi:hypothetical protein